MTDNDKPQDSPAPDTTVEASDDESATGDTAQQPAPPRPAGARAALFFALLSLLATGALAAGGYYLWQTQQQLASGQQQRLATLNTTLNELRRQQSTRDSQQNDRLDNLLAQQKNLGDALQTLIKSRSHLRNDWLLTEAEYLLKLANHRLLLERDVATAIVALQSADERLREVADPGLLTLRKRIAANINDLRAVAQPDLAGLSFNLSSLAEDVTRLPLDTPDPLSKQQAETPAPDKVENWQELPAALWRDIKSLVVIRHHDEPIQPLLAPEQRFYLTQNLQLQLEQARLALLNGQSRVYRERLQQASEWLTQYYDTDHSATQQMQAQLTQLADQTIHPELPDISATHQALQRFREQRREQASPDIPPDTDSDTDTNTGDNPSS